MLEAWRGTDITKRPVTPIQLDFEGTNSERATSGRHLGAFLTVNDREEVKSIHWQNIGLEK